MSLIRPLAVLCLSALLAAGTFSAPCRAQAPQTITLKDFRLQPVRIPLPGNRVGYPSDPQFTYQNGILTLNDPEQKDKVLWRGPLGDQPQVFRLMTGAGSNVLQDETGKEICRERFDPPGLTLTVGADGKTTLTDFAGKRLWTGQAKMAATNDTNSGGVPPAVGNGSPPGGQYVDSDGYGGFAYLVTRTGKAIFKDPGGHVFWTGAAPRHPGVRIVTPEGTGEGNVFRSPLYPPNKTLRVGLALEMDSVTISEGNGKHIGTMPTPALRMIIQDAADPTTSLLTSSGNNTQLPELSFSFSKPGIVNAVYTNPGNEVLQTERITISPVQKGPMKWQDGTMSAHYQEVTHAILFQGHYQTNSDMLVPVR